MSVEISRLRWRCRRGMLELDAWLLAFLDDGYSSLGSADRLAFSRLLEQDDGMLFAWLTGRADVPEWARGLLDKILNLKADA